MRPTHPASDADRNDKRGPSHDHDLLDEVPGRFNFTRDVIEAIAAADPRRNALTFVGADGVIDRLSFAEVAAAANRWSALLRARGLYPGDRLLVCVGETPAWPAIVLGGLKAGLVVVPCPEMLRPHELAFRGEHSEAQLVVADRERARHFAEMDVPVDVVVVEEVAAALRQLSAIQPTHDTESDDIAFILYTSGTSGEPKGAVHTHGFTWANRLQAQHWLRVSGDDLVWCTATTGSAKSVWNVLLGPWSVGAEIVMHEDAFDAEQRLELLDKLGVTVLCQTPTEYRLMTRLPSLGHYDLRRLRHAVSTGEPLDAQVISAFQDAFNRTVHDGYGQAENTILVANLRGMEIKPGSMGLPMPGQDVCVIDGEGNEQPAGVEGDLAVRGESPLHFLGYWDEPEATMAVFREQWYVTGDRAIRDEDGYLWSMGRADDVIISAGFRVGPVEVENALLQHEAVAECAVVGKPEAEGGETVKAFVVLRAGVRPSDDLATEIREGIEHMTAPYAIPREIEFVVALPKTASGKIRRVVLRQREERRAEEARRSGGESREDEERREGTEAPAAEEAADVAAQAEPDAEGQQGAGDGRDADRESAATATKGPALRVVAPATPKPRRGKGQGSAPAEPPAVGRAEAKTARTRPKVVRRRPAEPQTELEETTESASTAKKAPAQGRRNRKPPVEKAGQRGAGKKSQATEGKPSAKQEAGATSEPPASTQRKTRSKAPAS